MIGCNGARRPTAELVSCICCHEHLKCLSLAVIPAHSVSICNRSRSEMGEEFAEILNHSQWTRAELMPDGMCIQRYRPKGVWNVVKKDESSSCSICNKPLLTSRIVKTFASCSHVATSLIVGRGECSH